MDSYSNWWFWEEKNARNSFPIILLTSVSPVFPFVDCTFDIKCKNYLEKAMAPHSSTLAWKIPWTEEPGRLQSTGSLRVGHDWETSLSLFPFMHWRRKWQPAPVLLPGKSQGQRNLVGCHMGSHRVRHDWSDLAAAAGMWDLNSQIRDGTCIPCFGRQSLNHWTAREVPNYKYWL